MSSESQFRGAQGTSIGSPRLGCIPLTQSAYNIHQRGVRLGLLWLILLTCVFVSNYLRALSELQAPVND
jgi:hypothetical protein